MPLGTSKWCGCTKPSPTCEQCKSYCFFSPDHTRALPDKLPATHF
jgi:hypothetical protein